MSIFGQKTVKIFVHFYNFTKGGDVMKARHWLFLLGGILLAGILALCFLFSFKSAGMVAEIYQDGTLVRTIDLKEHQEIRLNQDGKENIILIEPDGVTMQSANCPDKLCVKQGKIQNGIYPIVCLPNKVVIELKVPKKSHPDTISR